MSDKTLPASWRWVPLAELAAREPNAITDGPFGSRLKTAHYTKAGPRVVRLQNIGEGEFLDERAHIAESHFDSLHKHRVHPGDLVIAALGETLPRACMIPASLGPAIVKADCIRFKPDPEVVSAKFLLYALISPQLREQAGSIIHGVGRPRLNQSEIKSLRVPLAPREEQARIVTEIEKQFTRLDAGVAALRRLEAHIRRCRSAVLVAAAQGRLVESEAEIARREKRPFESGSAFLTRVLANRRDNGKYGDPPQLDQSALPPLPKGWIWTTTESVGDILLGRQRAPQYLTGRYSRPYLRVANVGDDYIDTSDVKEMDFDPAHFVKYRLQPDDILVSEGQSPELLGQSAIYSGSIEGLCFQKTLHRFRPLPGGPSACFAQIVFRSHVRTGIFRRLGSITTNIGHLTLEKFKAAPFPIPPEAEQHRIVAEVEAKLSDIDALEAIVAANLSRGANLRSAVLRAAFGGRLVPQNPGDEPVKLDALRGAVADSAAEIAMGTKGPRIVKKAGAR